MIRWLLRLFSTRRRLQDLETRVEFLATELRETELRVRVILVTVNMHERILTQAVQTISEQSRALQQVNNLVCELANRAEDPGALDRWARNRAVN